MSIKLLSVEEIKSMRGELDIDRYRPPIKPCRKEWDVYRIVATLERLQERSPSKDTSTLDALDKLTEDFDMIGKTGEKIFISTKGKIFKADNIRELTTKAIKANS